jgi:hypothetical protein
MTYPSIDVAQRVAEERLQDCLRKAETDRVLREAGIDRRGWASRMACRLLYRLGHVLVALGQRLEAYELPAAGSSTSVHPRRPASLSR